MKPCDLDKNTKNKKVERENTVRRSTCLGGLQYTEVQAPNQENTLIKI